jgi:hypothetical protein
LTSLRADTLPALRPTPARAVGVALFAVLPAVLMVRLLRQPGLGWDFRVFYLAAQHYLHGVSPYSGRSLAVLAAKRAFVYPAPVAAFFVPLALLPYPLALWLWLVGSALAVVAALRILGVRDWRCAGALFLTAPVQQGIRLGTVMPALMLLLALLWRHRDRTAVAAATCGVVALSKLFLFPLFLWLAVTRRYRAALAAVALTALLVVVGWLPVLGSIGAYPSLLRALAAYEQTFSYSLTSFGISLGLSATAATAAAILAGAGALGVAVAARSDEYLAFRLAIGASFLMSPIVWGHYYVLLAVPLALTWPRLSPIWLAAIWIRPDTLDLHDTTLWIGCALLVLLLQLDLVRPLLRRSAASAGRRARQSLGVAVTAALLVAASAAAEPGRTRTVALVPLHGGPASGAATLRIDGPGRELCWRLWTQALRPGTARVEIRVGWRPMRGLAARTSVGPDGQAGGCLDLTRADRLVASALVSTGLAGQLTVTASHAAPISGRFAVP